MARRRRSRNETVSPTGLGVRAEMLPEVLLGAVDGVGVVAGGLLHLTRDVLLSAVTGAADIGAEALTATVSGARGMVSATSRMVGDMAGTARSSVSQTVALARHARGFAEPRLTARRPPVAMASREAEAGPAPVAVAAPTRRRRTRPAPRRAVA